MAERFSGGGQKRRRQRQGQRQRVMGSGIKIRKIMGWWLVIIMVMVGMMDNGVRECNAQWVSYFECAWECYLVEGAIQQLLCLADCMKRCTWRTRKCKADPKYLKHQRRKPPKECPPEFPKGFNCL